MPSCCRGFISKVNDLVSIKGDDKCSGKSTSARIGVQADCAILLSAPSHRSGFLWSLLLKSSIVYGDLAPRRFHCWMFPSAASESGYLEVSVDNVKGVQIGHRLQHLANHVAGVTLRVVTLVQDPVEHLPACGPAQKQKPTAVEEPGCAPSRRTGK